MSRRRSDNYTDRLMGDFKNNPLKNRKSLYERMYVRVLTEICTNRFNWVGLPDEIDKRFLELELFRRALTVFFWDDTYDRYFALRGSGAGKWNMYDNPVSFNVIGNTMINRMLKAGDDCIPIWANTMRTPDWDIVMLQSTKLAEVERTIEITLSLMRMPYIIGVDDNERLSFINMLRQVQEGQLAVFGTQGLTESIKDKVNLLDVGIDKEMVLNLQIAKSKIWNETMTLLGINNANQEKRERLVADEVSANDSQIMAVRNSSLSARVYAVELINKKFGLNIDVEWNESAPMGMTDSFVDLNDGTTTVSTALEDK